MTNSLEPWSLKYIHEGADVISFDGKVVASFFDSRDADQMLELISGQSQEVEDLKDANVEFEENEVKFQDRIKELEKELSNKGD